MIDINSRFIQLDSICALAKVDISVSEIHGIVVGAISNHLKTGVEPKLLSLIAPDANAEHGAYRQLNDVLLEIYQEYSDLLFNRSEEFELMLPDETESFTGRAEGLSDWCQGYLLGLLYNELFSIDQLDEDGSEFARDVMQISEMELDGDTDNEAEKALFELHEFVKVGVQLVFESIYSERASDAPKTLQ